MVPILTGVGLALAAMVSGMTEMDLALTILDLVLAELRHGPDYT
jgi:hypothetical protein